jgi:hypothetical protein
MKDRSSHITDLRPMDTLHADVLVVGAGAAGVAAAVTAARRGVKVVLLERYGFCGGAAVAGMSGTVCGLYAATAHPVQPEKILHGFVDDFIRAMESRNGLTGPIVYGNTFTRVHDPLVWREAADGLLLEGGITTVFHALVTDVHVEGGERVAGVRAFTKQGKLDVFARITVDASGDADIAAMCGFPTTVGHNGMVQNPTMIFRLQGVDVDRFLAAMGSNSILGPDIEELIESEQREGEDLPRRKVFLFPTPRPRELLCNATRIVGADSRELNPTRWRDFSEAEVQGRKQVRAYERFFRKHVIGCEQAFVNDTGVQVGVRQTRQIAGMQTLANDDVTSARKAADAVARSPWPIELHSGSKPRLVWIYDDYYEVPYGCFVPSRGEGLLATGRCLSAQHEAMASARVTGPCFGYGQAVGLAAAICSQEGLEPRRLSGTSLRSELNRLGARLDD